LAELNQLTVNEVKEMFLHVADKVIGSKDLLTEVDSAIGDGDHGTGMSVGFKQAIENLNSKELNTINDVFKTIGMSLISSMGGASGVIFGTVFLGGVKNLENTKTLDTNILAKIMTGSLEGVKERGKASLGDKTMIDALEPASDALNESSSEKLSFLEALKKAEKAAEEGVEKSKEYVAKFGRAKTLGERAIGHQDAGATSVWIIFKSMREWVETNNG